MQTLIRCSLLCLVCAGTAWSQSRDELVRNDRKKVEAEGFWMYNDIPGAFEKARETGKPIVVVLRCIPCHECVKLDDELVDTHPVIRPLLEQFVCVRQVATNGLDLSLFQFDTDQSFAVFFLNADKTIYGRFGTRSHRTDWVGDVSLTGLAEALRGALALHEDYDRAKGSLAAKRGAPMEFASPEQYPTLKTDFTDQLDYQGNVVKSCIHCHQIGDAQREYYWRARKPIPEKVLFPFPHPRVVGLTLDPDTMAAVESVEPESAAAQAGFRPGDVIEKFNGQPMLSIADVQWVLHNANPGGDRIPVHVLREDQPVELVLALSDGWRRAGDLSWRVSSWGLSRMTTGGMRLEPLPAADRAQLKIPESKMALRARAVGRYGAHATARKAGFRPGDVIVEYDGRDDFVTEAALVHYAVTSRKVGDRVEIAFLRDGRRRTLEIPLQP